MEIWDIRLDEIKWNKNKTKNTRIDISGGNRDNISEKLRKVVAYMHTA